MGFLNFCCSWLCCGGTFRKQSKFRVLIVGLDNGGKSTILEALKHLTAKHSSSSLKSTGPLHLHTAPTIGYSLDSIRLGDVTLSCVDMSGQGKYRNLWKSFVDGIDALIFVIDASDPLRFVVAKNELDDLLAHQEVRQRQLPILFFANKKDIPGSVSAIECREAMHLEGVRDHKWSIMLECMLLVNMHSERFCSLVFVCLL
eukprot:GHVQ01020437.1.p1 GENE.GHVQ01020437.1~~GHVQ01020437.1.p1  ORF type:complete len:201 (-),score=19.81 GHVQ01020437.1:62-664(-)